MKGIVLSAEDKTIQSRAKSSGLKVVVDPDRPFAFDKTLFVEPGVRVPWDLMPAAWHFLERWDAAVPLWRYGMTAQDIGSKEEREATRLVVRDLRVLLHSWELLFVRQNEAGCALVDTWKQEMSAGSEKRLAFLRALYIVKPRICVLPTTWLAEIRTQGQAARQTSRRGVPRRAGKNLVVVELEPGRFVKCRAGDEEKVLAQHEEQRAGRQ